ncbi:MAG: type II toxin-antitoxin system RelE/ParE family toxin [Chloroflexi bacterium]|nr:type II toxin-antitoxin system RelE/ParE family toxin [Chloroflexota bacterium]
MYELEFTPEADEDLSYLRKWEQKQITDAVKSQLEYEPTVETRNRKQLRRNPVAGWELRVGDFRVLYNVDEHMLAVEIVAVGVKIGDLLFVRGVRVEL